MRSTRAIVLGQSCLVLCVWLWGCGPIGGRRATVDTVYQRKLAEWVRDSALIEDLARQVPLDSFAALTRAMGEPRTHEWAVQERACEMLRLGYRFGGVPLEVALKRWQGPFYEAHPGLGERIDALRRPGAVVSLSQGTCNISDSLWNNRRKAPLYSSKPRKH